MKQININLYPKDGYYFKDKDGTRHIGTNWRDVIVRVTDYRKRNGLPIGTVEQEVHEQACEHNPAYCTEITEQQREMTKVVSLKGRVLAWLSGKIQGRSSEPLKFVEQAAERAAICLGCPKNIAFSDGCSSCKVAIKESRENLLGSRSIFAGINGCVVLGEDLPVSVHLDQQTVENSELPAHCWRRRGV